MLDNKPELLIHVSYRDRQVQTGCAADERLIIGRKYLQTLFGINGTSFRNISRTHLEIVYDPNTDQFWAKDSSLLGTLARTVGTNDAGPEFLYHHTHFLIKRRMQLRMQNEDEQREPDDVIIEIECQQYDETHPIVQPHSYWDRLLTQLQSTRTAHLVGLPGTGKSTLAKKLLAPSGTTWQRQRDRRLGGTALVAWVDCYLMERTSDVLWHQLARQMLLALHTAAEDHYLVAVSDDIQRALHYFDEHVTDRIGQINAAFRQALRAVVRQGLRPVFVLDHFDAAYAALDRFMLYQLYQFHQWPEIGEMLRYVIITRRPLDALRDDGLTGGVVEFDSLFARHGIELRLGQRDDFAAVWSQIALGHHDVLPAVLDGLHALCGGHPGLARELYEELAINSWLHRPACWAERLAQIDWQARPPHSCAALWEWLADDEKQIILRYCADEALTPAERQQLVATGLLTGSGRLFSPLFEQTLRQMASHGQHTTSALFVNVPLRRVYVNGYDVTPRLNGRKLDVLLYLQRHANRLCPYDELIKHTLPPETAFSDAYYESERGALQRTVSRLCAIVDPERCLIQNEQGRGYILRDGA